MTSHSILVTLLAMAVDNGMASTPLVKWSAITKRHLRRPARGILYIVDLDTLKWPQTQVFPHRGVFFCRGTGDKIITGLYCSPTIKKK